MYIYIERDKSYVCTNNKSLRLRIISSSFLYQELFFVSVSLQDSISVKMPRPFYAVVCFFFSDYANAEISRLFVNQVPLCIFYASSISISFLFIFLIWMSLMCAVQKMTSNKSKSFIFILFCSVFTYYFFTYCFLSLFFLICF